MANERSLFWALFFLEIRKHGGCVVSFLGIDESEDSHRIQCELIAPFPKSIIYPFFHQKALSLAAALAFLST